jgi:hypothetical protein
MQNSETCMFCRYRKARIAACCASQGMSPEPQARENPAKARTAPSEPNYLEGDALQPLQEDVMQFA